jgi:hypothetical protein
VSIVEGLAFNLYQFLLCSFNERKENWFRDVLVTSKAMTADQQSIKMINSFNFKELTVLSVVSEDFIFVLHWWGVTLYKSPHLWTYVCGNIWIVITLGDLFCFLVDSVYYWIILWSGDVTIADWTWWRMYVASPSLSYSLSHISHTSGKSVQSCSEELTLPWNTVTKENKARLQIITPAQINNKCHQ